MVYLIIKIGVPDNYLEVVATVKNAVGYCLGQVSSFNPDKITAWIFCKWVTPEYMTDYPQYIHPNLNVSNVKFSF